MNYLKVIKESMLMLANDPETIFLGQGVADGGTFMWNTFEDIDKSKRLEFPVAEQFQMQFSLGLCIKGYIPICVYPRQNFLLLAMSDMVNTVDKFNDIGAKLERGMIIRTAAGTTKPIFPGIQHVGDFNCGFCEMFSNIEVVTISFPRAMDVYKYALKRAKEGNHTLVIEYGDKYNE